MTVQINITVSAADGEYNAYEQSILDVVAGRAVGLSNVATPVAASTEEAKATIKEQADKQEAKEVAALEAEEAPAPKRKRRTRAEIEAEKEAKSQAEAEERDAAAAMADEEDDEEAEETPAEPEADEPQEDEEQDDQDDQEDEESDDEVSLDAAIAATTKLVSQRKQAVVKAALAKFKVKRVTELKADQVADYLEALEA